MSLGDEDGVLCGREDARLAGRLGEEAASKGRHVVGRGRSRVRHPYLHNGVGVGTVAGLGVGGTAGVRPVGLASVVIVLRGEGREGRRRVIGEYRGSDRRYSEKSTMTSARSAGAEKNSV